MVIARLLLLLALFAPSPVRAEPSSIPGGRLWVEVEDKGRAYHPQEMVLVRVRGLFTAPIALEKLATPEFPGFRALQLGGDVWTSTTDDGRPARAMQRTIALFPQRRGTLVIPPFLDRMTLIDAAGERREVALATEPQPLNIAPRPEDKGAWWLPARAVTLTESWSVPPETLAIGQSTLRTVTLEAEGLTDDQLPPPPALQAPGLIAFAEPAARETTIAIDLDTGTPEQRRQALRRPGRLAVVAGRDGPRARVSYRWNIRPTTDEAVTLPAIIIPWFDTDANVMRKAVLAERVVKVADGGRSVAALEADLGIAAPSAPTAEWPEFLSGFLAGCGVFVGILEVLRRRVWRA